MFLVLEGMDGSGKSSQAARLNAFLTRESGRETLLVREPGGTRLGERVRELLLEPLVRSTGATGVEESSDGPGRGEGDLTPEVELFLFMAARAQLATEKILPALRNGVIVISDRFVWSSVVYQGIVGGLDVSTILEMGRVATRGIVPTRTFVIDVEPRDAFARLGTHDRVEQRGLDFQVRVRDGFLRLARDMPEQFVVIDGAGSIEEVHGRVVAALPRPS